MRHSSQRGVALVVTLLMLSVITFLAVAFLALSSRERQSVTLTLTQSEAKLMADAGLARAEAEIAAAIRNKSNLLAAAMIVSRSYQNPRAFTAGTEGFTNVNYATVAPANYLPMLTNLYYDPRLPVFVRTNQNGPLDFRFFLDFNRNGRFDTNGSQPNLDLAGQVVQVNGQPQMVDLPGDPEFIGLLEKPELNHSGTNRGVGRFAFMVLPVGQSLDLNTMHNYAKGNTGLTPPTPMPLGATPDGFNRNQGVGSYEINYAGLLVDLSPNIYSVVPYAFRPTGFNQANTGTAFDDATSLLRYRYNGDFRSLPTAQTNFGPIGSLISQRVQNVFERDGIDGYAKNQFANGSDRPWNDFANQPWAGSRNPVEIRDTQELLDSTKFGARFVSNLQKMGQSTATLDRHGLYRLLSMATATVPPALENRINLNYTNDPSVNTFSSTYSNWNPLVFFTNVAQRLIQMSLTTNNTGQVLFDDMVVGTNFGIGHIPIYPATNNFYSSGLHRVLQLAANLYDATTTNANPTVFRPVFMRDVNGVSIAGYVPVTNAAILRPGQPGSLFEVGREELFNRFPVSSQPIDDRYLVYGVPMVVGAKKGLPNFNEIGLLTRFTLERKLEFLKRNSGDLLPYQTNQMLVVNMGNEVGIEAWNGYSNAYPRRLTMYCTNLTLTTISAQSRPTMVANILTNLTVSGSFAVSNILQPGGGYWQGKAFSLPLQSSTTILSNYVYNFRDQQFTNINAANVNRGLYLDNTFSTPDFWVAVTNRMRFTLVDEDLRDSTGRAGVVLDYVSLEFTFQTNMTTAITTQNPEAALSMWDTNRSGGPFSPTLGVLRQIAINTGLDQPTGAEARWLRSSLTREERPKSISSLAHFLGLPGNPLYPVDQDPVDNPKKAAYDLMGTFVGLAVWAANDPLVHYTPGDLTDPVNGPLLKISLPDGRQPTMAFLNEASVGLTLGRENRRYQPWKQSPSAPFRNAPELKDPMVRSPDDWTFPTNKLASVGEIGRIHRGTPWQTIYLKSGVATANDWTNWAGRISTHPTNDWFLPDLFTTAPSEEASRGLLSVNQTDSAAWSAVLSGVEVATNTTANPGIDVIPAFGFQRIVPASTQLRQIVEGINGYRAAQTPHNLFTFGGQILAVPELSLASPFLNRTGIQAEFGITDDTYERIPRRILSLIQLGSPRYLVYTYGQSLRPAEASLVNRFGFLNLVTNYQITGEVVTRTLMRVEGTPQAPRIVIEKYDVLPTD